MKALVFGMARWLGIARMPKLLAAAGFDVATLCPDDVFLAKTRYRSAHFPLDTSHGPSILTDLSRTMESWRPDIVVPGDNATVTILQEILLRDRDGGDTRLSEGAMAAIRRSMPPVESFDSTTLKVPFRRLCDSNRIRIPEWAVIQNVADGLEFAEEFGYPVVVKTNDTTGGAGVFVCRDEDSLAQAAFATLPQFGGPKVGGTGPVTVERFVQGTICHFCCVAWEGRLLAGAGAEKVRCYPDITGPGTIFKFIEASEAEELVGMFVARTQLTGFVGLDYIVEETTGRTFLLECNPRPVPLTTIATYADVDLAAALWAQLAGSPRPRFFLKVGTTVVMYPQERIRDPQATPLEGALLDRPDDDPELLAALDAHAEHVLQNQPTAGN